MLQQALDQPYQQLITSGCDRRLVVNADGLNPYGASVLPRRAIALGSCSCSSPSPRAAEAAQAALRELRGAHHPQHVMTLMREQIRGVLRESLLLAEDVQIAFTPSGTDLELLAAALVAGDEQQIVNILVAPDEVGSGTPMAASGRHYNRCLPRGGSAQTGNPVNGSLASRIELCTIDVRDRYGELLLPIEIDAATTEAAIAALDQDKKVLVHVVAHSKTGIHAPSLPTVEKLCYEMHGDVFGIVDAAQGRIAAEAYRAALDRGWMVAFTGSKFFGGPPFSGALLLPPSIDPTACGLSRLPPGLDDYFCTADLPETWFPIRATGNDWDNIGGLLRWTAAAAEIQTYFRVDPDIRHRIAGEFAAAIRHQFAETPHARLLKEFTPHDHDGTFAGIESATTVFSLALSDDQGNPLTRDQLKWVHRQLNAAAAATKFHLGQPVQIGAQRFVIRLALGAPLVIDIATSNRLGTGLTERLQWMKQMIRELGDRIEETVAAVPTADAFEANHA